MDLSISDSQSKYLIANSVEMIDLTAYLWILDHGSFETEIKLKYLDLKEYFQQNMPDLELSENQAQNSINALSVAKLIDLKISNDKDFTVIPHEIPKFTRRKNK